MGYSCAVAADYTLNEIRLLLNLKSSNGMPDGGFYEVGRENADGAITGTVWKPYGDGRVIRRGGFRINPDGTIARFPGLPARLLRQAENIGAQTYQRVHGPSLAPSWPARRVLILARLNDDGVDPKYLWDDVQDLVRAYQKERGIAFLVMPAINKESMTEFLNGLE